MTNAATKKAKIATAPKPLDLNAASLAQLESLPGIGADRARLIVAMRERNGPFRCVEELKVLPRLTDKQLEKLQELVVVEGGRDCRSESPSKR